MSDFFGPVENSTANAEDTTADDSVGLSDKELSDIVNDRDDSESGESNS